MPIVDPERAMSVFRTARGVGLLVAPARSVGTGPVTARATADLAIRREWLTAGVVVDLIDLVATIGHRRALTWTEWRWRSWPP